MEDDKIMEHKSGLNHGFETNLRPNTGIAPDSDKLGLVDPHRLLTWVWSTPKQAIPLIFYIDLFFQKCQKIIVDQTLSYVS